MKLDRIITSTKVLVGFEDSPRPAALAIKGDRIVFAGSLERARALDPSCEVQDFGDRLIIPGFHDSHMHFFHSALYASPLAEAYRGENEADCVARLAPLAKRRPTGWLLTQGWRDYRWNPKGLPSKHSLDTAYPDRPVAMYSGDAHTLWVNSCALRELGLTNESVPPAGGSYDRDENGELTGIIREAAAMELMPQIVGSFTQDELESAYLDYMRYMNKRGITAFCDMSLMAHPGLDFVRDDIYASLEAQGKLTLRTHMFPTLLDDLSRFENMHARYTSPLLQTPGFKQFFDGVSSQHTAYVKEPYTNARFEGDCGMTTVAPEVMRNLVMKAAEKHYPVRIHTIGDQAIHLALDIFEEARERFGAPLGQNCLEHCENFQPEDMARMAALDVEAACQPCHITLDPGGPERDLGPERVPYMWPFKTLLELGVKLGFGTDAPVCDTNPFNTLYTAVTRKDAKTEEPSGGWLPEQKISMIQALRAYTYGSAQACGRAHELGYLGVGAFADFAVLEQDLFELESPEAIKEVEVHATFVGGTCVWNAEQACGVWSAQ